MFCVPVAHGQNGFDPSELIRLSPVVFTPTLDPATRTEYILTVENLTEKAFPATLTFEGFDTVNEIGGYNFNNAPSLLSRWIEFPQREILLPANSKKAVSFYLNVSSRVPLGGYYGVIFVNPALATSSESIVLAPKVGALMLANIGVPENQKNKIEILDFSPELLSDDGNTKYILRVQNKSLFHFTAKPILEVYPLLGEKQKVFIEEKFIFPGKIRRWEGTFNLSKTPNIYKATMKVSIGNGKQIYKNAYVIVFPLKSFLIISVILGSAFLIIYQHKRIYKAIRILITGKN